MLKLAHIVISAESLLVGQEFIEDKLGIKADPGREHPVFGTHNKLISFCDTYLEIIAVSLELVPERVPRWFNLDNFTGEPRITNWVCSTSLVNFFQMI